MKSHTNSSSWRQVAFVISISLLFLNRSQAAIAPSETGLTIGGSQDAASTAVAGVLRQVYSDIPGTLVSDLTNAAVFPGSPSSEDITSNFEAPINVAENYGQRMMALLTPPATGDYTFWIASDDASTLFLSTDDLPVNRSEIAWVSGWTASRAWTTYPEQQSAAIRLNAGQKYYIEALMKEGGGGDNLAVRWQLPDGTIEEPIPGSRLTVYGLGPPTITAEPTNMTVLEGGNATFSVQAGRITGMTYQWKRNDTSIPSATNASYTLYAVSLSDTGSRFRCLLVNAQGSALSREAVLSVTPDTTPPTLVSVTSLGDPSVITVLFSEPVEAASALVAGNYALNGGAAVLGVAFAGDSQTVVLRTSPLSLGSTYTLTVNDIYDKASSPNAVAPNTQKGFTLEYTPLDSSFVKGATEPLGPSNRRSGLVISEIMCHPAARADGRNLEFVELFNANDWPEDIGGFRLTGDIDYTFTSNTVINARSYLVVAAMPADVQAVYSLTGVYGPFAKNLSNSGGTIRLRNRINGVLVDAQYSADPPYPVAADGAGHSLVLVRPSYGERDPRAWGASGVIGGSPGKAEPSVTDPYGALVINELLSHTDDPEVDFIELHNYSKATVNLAGCYLSDDPSTNKFRFPNGATIAPLGFVVVTQDELGFALSAQGETVFLVNSNQTRVIDAVRFGGQANGVSSGRFPDGAANFQELSARTPGASNARFLERDLVIDEVMYDPISGDSDDEYVELHNRGSTPISLGNYRNLGPLELRGGISFTFPATAVIPANGYVVVAKNAGRLQTNYALLNGANTFGNFKGKLANGGDHILLTIPEELIGTNDLGDLTTNLTQIVIDEITYGVGGRWGQWSHGGGSSLELIDARADNRLASNWADSDETAKAPWTTVSFSGPLDNGNGAADELQILLQGAGECLVDNIEVMASGGSNLMPNGDFENGLTGWVPQGNHDQSGLENSGYASGHCLHIRAQGRGDHGANRIRANLSSPLSPGATATIRAKVRWLKGQPELLLRLHGNWIELIGRMTVPANLGTPGAPNSRATSNAGPAIFNVTHRPVLPAAGQTVTVTAQIQDPDGLASVVLKYRLDPSTNILSLGMLYNGAGFYSATIPAQTAGTLVAFHIQATDLAPTNATARFPMDAPSRECLVLFGETQPTGNFGTYRLWLTQATVNRWSRRLPLDNTALDGTFVYGNNRVVHNMGALYSGSPWISPGYNGPLGGLCGYVLEFPDDDLLLGTGSFVLDWPIRDGTQQLEQIAHWIGDQLGVPYDHRRFVHLFVNGNRRGTIYEDAQQPGSDVLNQWFAEDPDGDLFKIDDWFEFDDNASKEFNVDASLQDFTTTGGAKKLARYRWNWRKRATDTPNDYTTLFALVDAVNAADPEPYTSKVNALIDVEQWMRVFTVEHLVGNWDSYGYNRGKNMYNYKPTRGKFQLLMWDIDFVMSAGGDGPGTSMFNTGDPMMSRLLKYPPFLRTYYRAWTDAVNGPLQANRFGPVMDARYAGLEANGIGASSPQAGKDYLNNRRLFLQQELAKVASPFTITLNNGKPLTTNKNLIALTGKAPVGIKTVEINGIGYPITWTTITNWSALVPLAYGTNQIVVNGYDTAGNFYSNAVASLTVNCTLAPEAAQDRVVLNEIQYHPLVTGSAFVELFNASTTTTFDLSFWRLNGVDYTFPEGTLLSPQCYLVVAEDPVVFARVYGANLPVVGPYAGQLEHNGETLSLIKPGATPEQDQVIEEVTYDDKAPWPVAADGHGPSLQLIDATQDNGRVANWSSAATNATVLYTPGTNNSTRATIAALPPLWINEIQAENLSGPVTLAGLHSPWIELFNAGTTNINLDTYWLTDNYTNLQKWSFPANTIIDPGQFLVVWCDGQTNAISGEIHAGFTLAPYSGSVALTRQQGGKAVVFEYLNHNHLFPDYSYGAFPDGQRRQHQSFFHSTPGQTNNPADPPANIRINEWMASNTRTLLDPATQSHEDWFELYNDGDDTIDLSRFTLTDDSTNRVKFSIPRGFALRPGEFLLVWADEKSSANDSDANPHVNFKLSQKGEFIGLYSPQGAILDEVTFGPQTNDLSEGRWPDGHATGVYLMPQPTPGGPNTIPGTGQTNTAPQLDFIADQSIDESVLLSFKAMATDADEPAQRLTFRLEAGAPPGATINPATGQFNWTPLESQGPGIYPMTIRVTDNGVPNLSASQTFTVTVREVNAPPVIPAVGDQTAFEAIPLVFPVSAYDPDIPAQTLAFSLDPGQPAGATIDAVTGIFSWTPTLAQVPGTNVVTIRVTDNGTPQLTATQTVTIIALPTNHPPVLAVIPDQILDEKTTLSLQAYGSDHDAGQTLLYSLDPGAPPNLTLDRLSGEIRWTPTESQGPSTNFITVRLTDSGTPIGHATQTFKVVVREVNEPPVWNTLANRTVEPGQTLSLRLEATDPDVPGNQLTYGLEPGAPVGINVVPTNGLLTWTPTEAQGNSTNTLTVRATDDGTPALSALASFQVIVSPAPRWRFVSVTGTASASVLYIYLDRAGDAYIDDVKLVAGTSTASGANVLVNGDFENALAGSWTVSTNLTASSPSQAFKRSGSNSLHVIASSAGTTRNSSIFQDITPVLSTGDPYTLSYWFLPGSNNVNLTLRLSGNGIVSGTNLVPLENHSPTLAPPANLFAQPGDTVAFDAQAVDPDNEQTLSFTLDPGFPSGASLAKNGHFSWTIPAGTTPGTNVLTLRVTDNGLPVMTDAKSFFITVRPPVEVRFDEIRLDGDWWIALRCQANTGVTYQLQCKTNLSQPAWLDLAEATAQSGRVIFTNRIDGATSQFYRLLRKN